MKHYAPFVECDYGNLDAKVDLKPDFFTGFEPALRDKIVAEEAEFYRSITEKFSVNDRVEKYYINVAVRDGAKIPVKVYRPINADEKLPAFVFMHGGGFITCSAETHDYVPSYIAANAGLVCFSIDYRLAPEHKFPKGLEDCYDVTKWIYSQAEALCIDREKLIVGGDSSGGNFAAVLTQMARDSRDFNVSKQVLIYPATDFSGDIPKRSAQVYTMVGANDNGKAPSFLELYLPAGADVRNPMVSPLLTDNFTGLPEALFIQAECDSLCDDGLYYANELNSANANVVCEIYRGMPHAFILRTYEETFRALDSICSFVRN